MCVAESMPETVWADIPGYPYQVSDDGRVRNLRGKIIRSHPGRNGAQQVKLRKNRGVVRLRMVHNLVMRAFTGSPTHERYDEYWVKHLTLDKSDNRLEALAWTNEPR